MRSGQKAVTSVVAPGTYRVRALYHTGIDANYEQQFYNPGTPAWETVDGTGAWEVSPGGRVTRTLGGRSGTTRQGASGWGRPGAPERRFAD